MVISPSSLCLLRHSAALGAFRRNQSRDSLFCDLFIAFGCCDVCDIYCGLVHRRRLDFSRLISTDQRSISARSMPISEDAGNLDIQV